MPRMMNIRMLLSVSGSASAERDAIKSIREILSHEWILKGKRMKEMKRDFGLTAMLAAWVLTFALAAGSVRAEEKKADANNMEILREKIPADKKLVVAANIDLTAAEAKALWPLYQEYQTK
jgi:hypothetical protein